MRALELRIPPVPLAAAFAAAMWGFARLTSWADFALSGRKAASLGLAGLGAALAVAGVVAFRASRTTVNPLTPAASSTLVTTGVYRFSRNPMYLGFLLVLAAWAVWLSNAVAVLALPAFVACMNRFQIRPEERILLTKFGSRFSDYTATVRRWV